MKPAILVVDEDHALCQRLNDVLSEHGLTVYSSTRGAEALRSLALHHDISLVMLAMILPDTNGLLLLQQIQHLRPEMLVIMLTGMDTETDTVIGLEMGADDCIAKLCNPRLLVARTKAILRRSGIVARSNAQDTPHGWQFNGWRLDENRCTLCNPDSEEVALTQGEYSLLLAMVRHARKVLTRDQLLELTHSETLDVLDRTIDVLIMRLRRKIEVNPHQPTLIRTMRGLGYVFAADVARLDTSPPASRIA